jgi:hypothetical protein
VCAALAPSTAQCIVGECVTTLVSTTPGEANDLAVSATHVYFTSETDNNVSRIPTG